MSREHHVEDVVNRGAAGAVKADQALMVATADLPTECIVIATRNAMPPAPASAGDELFQNEKTRGDHEGHRGFDQFLGALFRHKAELDARSTPA
jgi:hypothetical protein